MTNTTMVEALRARAKDLMRMADDLEKLEQYLVGRLPGPVVAFHSKRKPISLEGRAKIRAAQKKRWDAIRKAKAKGKRGPVRKPKVKQALDPLVERA